MPLKCFSGELELFAFQFNNENWELLREQNRKSKNLKMPCCSSGVVLKQSKLMTRFFAHARKGPCTTQSETPEHLLAKAEIAKAIEAAGWIAATECSGTSPAGNCWTADVIARKAELQVAFEVQWSPQSDTETTLRQERYKDSSVRGLWLFRQKDFVSSKEIPAFKLNFNAEKKSFSVVVCAGYYSTQTIELRRFIGGALKGALKFAPASGRVLPLEILGDGVDCWKCKRPSRAITHFNIAASKLFKGFSDWDFNLSDIDNLPITQKLLSQILPSPSHLKNAGIGQIKPRFSKTVGYSYLSNGCVHCDVLFGNYFTHASNNPIKLFDSEISLTTELLSAVDVISHGAEAWWFNESIIAE